MPNFNIGIPVTITNIEDEKEKYNILMTKEYFENSLVNKGYNGISVNGKKYTVNPATAVKNVSLKPVEDVENMNGFIAEKLLVNNKKILDDYSNYEILHSKKFYELKLDNVKNDENNPIKNLKNIKGKFKDQCEEEITDDNGNKFNPSIYKFSVKNSIKNNQDIIFLIIILKSKNSII